MLPVVVLGYEEYFLPRNRGRWDGRASGSAGLAVCDMDAML